MDAYQNYNAVVVNLEPDSNAMTSVTKTATYEQAFLGEDFSEAGGNRRKRRQARRLERVANKRELRTEKRKLKGDKQEERIERRRKRKTKRQDIRDEQMERRKARREKRKPEEDEEETTKPTESTQDEMGDSSEQGYDEQDDLDQQETQNEDSDETDDYGDEDSYGDEDGSSSDEVFAEDEESNFVSELSGSTNVPKSVKVICWQIEMTNEALSNLMQLKAIKKQKGQNTETIDKQMLDKFNQAQKLESKLEQFSGANGVSSSAIKKEKRKARAKRLMNAPIPPVIMAKMLKKGWDKSKIKQWWEQRGRGAMMSKFSFDGTTDEFGTTNELNEYVNPDDMGVPVYDYDQPEAELVNLDFSSTTSNFSGSSDNFMRSLVIGGIVAFVGIWAIRKYKLLS